MVRRAAFLKKLVSSLCRYIGLYPFTRPSRTRAFLNALAQWVVLYDVRERQKLGKHTIPLIELTELFPDITRVPLTIPYTVLRDGNPALGEVLALCAMVKQTGSKGIFEFGTFDGFTTLCLAMNSDTDARIFTLDLPPQDAWALKYPVDPADLKYLPRAPEHVDARFGSTAVAYKITQLYGDSAIFDYAAYHEAMSFIFIDGSHSYQYVRSDTRNAFAMLDDGGVIVWHDYSLIWADVFHFLEELGEQRQLFQIANTSLVVYRANSIK